MLAPAQVAAGLGLAYLDTGAMYRAAAWWCERRGVDLGDAAAVAGAVRAMPLDMGLDPRSPGVVCDGVDIAANARSWGLDVLEVHTIEEFKEAYARAHAGEEAAMIHIETDLYGPNPPSSSWWDVAVSGVSRLESTQRAYERYLEDRRPQRHYL